MAAAADATTAMTIDFLRARLLSERCVSRAAKERADQLASRVAELEEQLRAVTAQRRKAERAAAEVVAILDTQGFGSLSDATDGSCSDGEPDDGGPGAAETVRGGGGGNEPEDALSGSELGGQAAAVAQAGGLSWKGRAAGHEWDRRRPPPQQQQKGRQLRQRQGCHGHRRGYFYPRAADSSPKYHPGQSCRKIKRKELRSQREGMVDVAGESAEEGQERSDCTVCTDHEQPDLDGEVSHDGRGSSSNGRGEGGSDMDCGEDGEMERVLEKQAELIGQYQAQENAQREWEKKFSESRDSTVGSVNLSNKLNQTENACGKSETAQIVDKEVFCEQSRLSKNNHFGINMLSEYLPEGSVSGLLPSAATDCTIEECKVDESDHNFGKATATVASSSGELQVRKDVLASKSYLETVDRTSNNLEKAALSPQEKFDSSLNAEQNNCQGDSDSGSSYNANARSCERYINTHWVGSPSCDTPKSEVSEWSSSCFHNQLDTQLYRSSCNDVGGVLEALQRAKMSLREKLSSPSPPSQNQLALPAPEDQYTKDDLRVTEMQLSLSRSTPLSHEILALQAPAYYLNRIAPHGGTNVPVSQAGLFRVPTDSSPKNWMASTVFYDGSRSSVTGTTQFNTSPSYTVNHIRPTSPSFHTFPESYPHSYVMQPMPTAGGCSIPESDFRIEGASFPSEIPRPRNSLRKMLSGDAGMHFQYARE